MFSSDAVDRISDAFAVASAEDAGGEAMSDQAREALAACLGGLGGEDRMLLERRYREGTAVKDIPFQPPEQVEKVIDEIRAHFFHRQRASIGPRFDWDSRDNTFYPRRGVFMDFEADLFARGLGSKWTYQYYKVAFNKYAKLGEH